MAEVATTSTTTEEGDKYSSLLKWLKVGTDTLGGVASGYVDKKTAYAKAAILYHNAASYNYSAAIAREQGAAEYQEIKKQTQQLIGSQRASLAANGVVVDQDTALELAIQTAGIGAADAVEALNNAEREAVALTNKSKMAEYKAQQSKKAGNVALVKGLTSGAQQSKKAGNVAPVKGLTSGATTILGALGTK